MQSNTDSQGMFSMILKLLIVFTIFGVFPVVITIVVYNYNQRAEGIIQRNSSLDTVQTEIQEEVKILTQEDANALQKINEYTLGEWSNPIDPDYRIRFEQDNSFNEYRKGERIGYGLWRATVHHFYKEDIDSMTIQDIATSSTGVTGEYGVPGEREPAFQPDISVGYYLVRTQFESGKKSAPVKYKITYITDLKMTVFLENGAAINFERSL